MQAAGFNITNVKIVYGLDGSETEIEEWSNAARATVLEIAGANVARKIS